jgi:hypothetical protein
MNSSSTMSPFESALGEAQHLGFSKQRLSSRKPPKNGKIRRVPLFGVALKNRLPGHRGAGSRPPWRPMSFEMGRSEVNRFDSIAISAK